MHIDCIKIIFMQSIFLWYNTIYNINGFIVVCKSTTVYCLKIRNTLNCFLSQENENILSEKVLFNENAIFFSDL